MQALIVDQGEGVLQALSFLVPWSSSHEALTSHAFDLLELGVERATPHDLRRTFSTTVTGLGFGRDALNRITNHERAASRGSTTDTPMRTRTSA